MVVYIEKNFHGDEHFDTAGILAWQSRETAGVPNNNWIQFRGLVPRSSCYLHMELMSLYLQHGTLLSITLWLITRWLNVGNAKPYWKDEPVGDIKLLFRCIIRLVRAATIQRQQLLWISAHCHNLLGNLMELSYLFNEVSFTCFFFSSV